MAEETEFAMGATASCVDGPGGKVSRVIIDPATETVTHLVIGPKHRLGVGRLVPLDLVDTTASDIRLRCTVEEFDRLEPAQEMELVDDVIGGLNAPMGAAGRAFPRRRLVHAFTSRFRGNAIPTAFRETRPFTPGGGRA